MSEGTNAACQARSCHSCAFASQPYQIKNEGLYPPISIYIQCNVPISDELRAILPTSFYRESATRIGAVHPEKGTDVMFDVGNDCPCWAVKKTGNG
jgi:hypothetical protein